MDTEIEYGADYPEILEPGSPRKVRYYRDHYGKPDRQQAESTVRYINNRIKSFGQSMPGEEAFLIQRTVTYGESTRVKSTS